MAGLWSLKTGGCAGGTGSSIAYVPMWRNFALKVIIAHLMSAVPGIEFFCAGFLRFFLQRYGSVAAGITDFFYRQGQLFFEAVRRFP